MTIIKKTEHLILFKRRRSFGITAILSFNDQTIIRYIGRNGFESWPTTLESVTLVVSSRFTVLYIIFWFLTCAEVLCKSSCTAVWFVLILWFSGSRFRDSLREHIQCWLTDLNYQCSQACDLLLQCIIIVAWPDH